MIVPPIHPQLATIGGFRIRRSGLTMVPRSVWWIDALTRLVFACAAFAILSFLILHRPDWKLRDFDQGFYVTIAYDLEKYGVFTNGPFATTDSTIERPSPGMFFGPAFPALVFAVMKLDARFAEAVACSVEANRGHRDEATCEAYEVPVRLANAFLLVIGLISIAYAAEIIFKNKWTFFVAGSLTLVALAAETFIFSFVMTESTIFSIYSVLALITLLGWRTGLARYFALSGGFLGLLCLTKPSFLILFPVIATLSLLQGNLLAKRHLPNILGTLLAFSFAFSLVIGLWVGRNAISVGKFGLTEEYGSVAIVERLAYDDMTPREFFLAFPYCTPGIGNLGFDLIDGADSMHRFVYDTPGSFFNMGRDHRNILVREHERLDPIIGAIVWDEMRAKWWRYFLVTIPLAWCGMWPGWLVSLALVPLFGSACARAFTAGQPLLLLYSAPAVAMLGLNAAVGNHYTRYNLILIGPYAVGAAITVTYWLLHARSRSQPPASKRLAFRSGSATSDGDLE